MGEFNIFYLFIYVLLKWQFFQMFASGNRCLPEFKCLSLGFFLSPEKYIFFIVIRPYNARNILALNYANVE